MRDGLPVLDTDTIIRVPCYTDTDTAQWRDGRHCSGADSICGLQGTAEGAHACGVQDVRGGLDPLPPRCRTLGGGRRSAGPKRAPRRLARSAFAIVAAQTHILRVVRPKN